MADSSVDIYNQGHCGIYTRLTVDITTLLTEESFECQEIFIYIKTQPGPVAKKCNFGLSGWGNRTRDLANLVQCSTTLAMEADAESMASSSVYIW